MPDRAPEIAGFIAEALGEIGFDVAIDREEDRPAYARQVGAKAIGDIALFDSSPHSTFRVLDDKVSGRTQGVWWQGADDPELEPLITEAGATLDTDRRAEAYGRCLRRLNARPPWLYLFHPVEVMAHRPQARGIGLDAKGVLTWDA